MNADVVLRQANYGLELVDGLTEGPLIGRSDVVETTAHLATYRVNASRWAFEVLPMRPPAPPFVVVTFVITAHNYVPQTLTTGGTLPNPQPGVPGNLERIRMWPRTGYPFPPNLTRVVGQVRLDRSVDPTTPPVPRASVTYTPVHRAANGTSTNGAAITLTTTDDGQYTFWFHPVVSNPSVDPPLANEVAVTATATGSHGVVQGSISSLPVTANAVTYASTIYLR